MVRIVKKFFLYDIVGVAFYWLFSNFSITNNICYARYHITGRKREAVSMI
jgi:hypothetical protein